jgi:RNA polymerase sigma factor (TIGR02999 family)
MANVTQILVAAAAGDPQAAAELLPLVYDELRKLAAARLADEKPGQTLQPTALVHEAYLRLVGGQRFDHTGHFFAAAAEAMRRILVDRARRAQAERHGGGRRRQDLDLLDPAVPPDGDDLLALDEALGKLAAADPTAARLVTLRYFSGLTVPQAAEVLGVAPRTADRLWAYARAFLHTEIYPDQ